MIVSFVAGLLVTAASAATDRAVVVGQLNGAANLHFSHVHRGGGRKEAPDNTLETFRWCWQSGSGVECDCTYTKDGVGIMLHDGNLKRTGRGLSAELATNSVRNLTWDQIKDVDVGLYQGKQFKGQHVPRIDAVFAVLRENPKYLCFVDDKGFGPERMAAEAKKAGVQDQVFYTGKHVCYRQFAKWNEVMPGGRSLMWIGAWPKDRSDGERARAEQYFRDAMKFLRAKNFKYITAVSIHSYYSAEDPVDKFIPSSKLLKEMVDEFHSHGIVCVSIPFAGGDKEETYRQLWNLGFDGFSTDYPSVMFKVIEELSLPNVDA